MSKEQAQAWQAGWEAGRVYASRAMNWHMPPPERPTNPHLFQQAESDYVTTHRLCDACLDARGPAEKQPGPTEPTDADNTSDYYGAA